MSAVPRATGQAPNGGLMVYNTSLAGVDATIGNVMVIESVN